MQIPKPKSLRARTQRKELMESSSEDEKEEEEGEEGGEEEEDIQTKIKPRNQPKTRTSRMKGRNLLLSSDEEDNENFDPNREVSKPLKSVKSVQPLGKRLFLLFLLLNQEIEPKPNQNRVAKQTLED